MFQLVPYLWIYFQMGGTDEVYRYCFFLMFYNHIFTGQKQVSDFMKLFVKPFYLYSAAIATFFLNCFVCCPKDVTEEAVLNLHFQGLQTADTIILNYHGQSGNQDSTVFLYDPERPVKVSFYDFGSNSLEANLDYILVRVPETPLTDTLSNIAISREEQGGCRKPDRTLISLEKDGIQTSPDAVINLYY